MLKVFLLFLGHAAVHGNILLLLGARLRLRFALFSVGLHPVMPEPQKEQFRGKFQCKLCPHKILLTEKLLEMHLASSEHKKNEKRFERAQALGVEAYTEECKAKAEARAKQK